jgi:hypothetical protein
MTQRDRYFSRIDYCTQMAHAVWDPNVRAIWLAIKESYELLAQLERAPSPGRALEPTGKDPTPQISRS